MSNSLTHSILHLLRRELRALWRTRWLGVVGTLGVSAQGLWVMLIAIGTTPRTGIAIIEDLFYVSFGVSMVLAIVLSMRTFAEEYARHTWLVLASSPLPSWVIVGVKWMASLVTLTMMTLCTLPIALYIASMGNLSAGHLVAGYTGLLLMQGAALAIGTWASTLGPRQLVAATLSAATLGALTSTWMLAGIAPPPFSQLLMNMSFFEGNFRGFMAGRLMLSGGVYYVGITACALCAATQVIRARRHV